MKLTKRELENKIKLLNDDDPVIISVDIQSEKYPFLRVQADELNDYNVQVIKDAVELNLIFDGTLNEDYDHDEDSEKEWILQINSEPVNKIFTDSEKQVIDLFYEKSYQCDEISWTEIKK